MTEANPFDFGERVKRAQQEKVQQDNKKQNIPLIKFTPFVWRAANTIPMRDWLYSKHYIRQFLSSAVSSGGVGKSSLLIVEALSMVTMKELLNFQPKELLRVCYWNGEDPMEELERRFAAVNKHYGIKPDDIGDRLFLDSGRLLPIVIAEDTKTGTKIATPVIEGLIKALKDNKIDVLIIDPFISCHQVSENDNTAINKVAAAFSFIAEKANCSIMLAHHTKKMNSGNGTTSVEDGRGASSLRDATRAGRTLNNMTEKEAEVAKITQQRRSFYFSADSGTKHNMTPAADKEWFNLVSVDMDNNPVKGMPGEHVGVVTAWEFPQATVRPTVLSKHIKQAQEIISAGGPWRDNWQSKKEPWVGIPIAKVMGVSTDFKPDRQWIEKVVLDWIMEGFLERVKLPDTNRKERDFVQTGKPPPGQYNPHVPF